jgi:hypothetical protein
MFGVDSTNLNSLKREVCDMNFWKADEVWHIAGAK